MRRQKTTLTGKRAVRATGRIIEEELGWIFRSMDVEDDYGIDAYAEITVDDGDPDSDLVAGRVIALQIKGGKSRFKRKETATGWKFTSDSDHLSYWLGYSLPVIIVIVDSAGKAYWQQVITQAVNETNKGFSLEIPRVNTLDKDSLNALVAIAGRNIGLIESLPRFYTTLPTDAVRALRRAEEVDRLAAARLADRLSEGRLQAGFTVSALLGARPTWLITSPAEQDLWLAVGGYAAEHQHDLLAADAFSLAADANGPRSSRARAFAGLSLLFEDRQRARGPLEQAKAEGQEMLADIGLSAIDIPIDDARVLNVPASIRNASPEQLNAEPPALNFLAEVALRKGDLTTAIGYRRRAVASGGEGASELQLELAKNLLRRSAQEGGSSRKDLREALTLAQTAVAERRRWNGPSSEALAVLLDVLQMADEFREVIAEATPELEGGRAREHEAQSEDIASRGARASLILDDATAWQAFLSRLPDGLIKQELLALHAELPLGEPPAEAVALWERLAAEATDDAMIARCVAHLAHLGVWSGRADDLINRSILSDNDAALLRAIYRSRSDDCEAGREELRQLAQTSAQAAMELVLSLEQVSLMTAIKESQIQVARWHSPLATQQLIDLLRRAGRSDEAAEVMAKSVRDASFSDETRQALARRLSRQYAREGKFHEAANAARAGLDITDDPALSWELIRALYHSANVVDARKALDRYRPQPGTMPEIRLWLQLHLGVALNEADADIMLELANRVADTSLRGAILGLLVREVLMTPPDPTSAYPNRIVDAVQILAAEIESGSIPGLRVIPENDDRLRAALERDQSDPAEFNELLSQVRLGRIPLAEVANAADRPYGTALLQRPAGVIVAADSGPDLRSFGQKAAALAMESPRCIIDLSVLRILTMLPPKLRDDLCSALGELLIPASAVDDAVRTRDDIRTLAIASYTAALQADGSIEHSTLSPSQQAKLRDEAQALEALASSLSAVSCAGYAGPAAQAIELAKDHAAPLWCDDSAMRQQARGRTITTFSTADLMEVLGERGSVNTANGFRALSLQYVVDLPLTGDDIIAVASESLWQVGPAHTVLSRPGWWRNYSEGWHEHWLNIATAAASTSADALTLIVKAALNGAMNDVGPSYATARYQKVAVLALVACHIAGIKSPDLLSNIAEHARQDIIPKPEYVLKALIEELGSRGFANPDLKALALLPGIGLY